MLAPGDEFAGYRIERQLGQGGMGSVYLAHHPRLPRQIALKLLNPGMFTDTAIRLRFEREADLVAKLDHPNIVTVYDRGTEGDQPWISMPYIDGADLSALDPSTITVERTARIIASVAAALDYAHAKDILHRDVKPANIMVQPAAPGRDEQVLLTDFGIARLRQDTAGLTATGTFTATIAFASPEQLSSGALGPESDQYSLACTLYRLLTGTGPFDAANPAAVVAGHLHSPAPPISARRDGLPTALDAVLARALAKQPAARFASCGDFALAVADIADGSSTMARRRAITERRGRSDVRGQLGHTRALAHSDASAAQPGGQRPAPSSVLTSPRPAGARSASHRRRRSARWLLGTAAVVIVLGVAATIAITTRDSDAPAKGPVPSSVPSDPEQVAMRNAFANLVPEPDGTDHGRIGTNDCSWRTPGQDLRTNSGNAVWSNNQWVAAADCVSGDAGQTPTGYVVFAYPSPEAAAAAIDRLPPNTQATEIAGGRGYTTHRWIAPFDPAWNQVGVLAGFQGQPERARYLLYGYRGARIDSSTSSAEQASLVWFASLPL
ncbi:serine/threonine-protein kinase [Nocardia suismassiliense]|uniref:serine/threonine-protein kinase n=1 Tax=Nocardia suismassiliense TaxID=2077092 RepID=UPI000D1E891A|nr:serine/threonine-protein kinase [Nocardia suismassiliense]